VKRPCDAYFQFLLKTKHSKGATWRLWVVLTFLTSMQIQNTRGLRNTNQFCNTNWVSNN
jgi:hypothetical protein